jgi:hypothetical protein
MSVVTDLTDQQTLSYNANGYKAKRVFFVDSVSGSAEEKLFNALNDSGIPDYGDAYPSISTISVVDINAKPLKTGTQFHVTVMYEDPSINGTGTTTSAATVNVSATTASEHTDSDSSGARLESRWRDNLGAYDHATYFTAEVDRPRFTIDFEYTTATYPKTQIDTYMNRVNSVTWNGYAPKTILCSAINVSSTGAEYKVRFSFVYNEDTWQFLGSVKTIGVLLPLTAHSTAPDSDITLSTGVKAFDVYATVDFTSLGFSL